MWVAGPVAKGMMLTMDRNPRKQRPLRRHGARNCQQQAHAWTGFKRTVREVAVQTDGHAAHRDEVHEQENSNLHRGDAVTDAEIGRAYRPDNRRRHHQKCDDALQPHAVTANDDRIPHSGDGRAYCCDSVTANSSSLTRAALAEASKAAPRCRDNCAMVG